MTAVLEVPELEEGYVPEWFDLEACRDRLAEEEAKALELGFKPPPTLTVSEWADAYRFLPATASERGRWRTSRTPYLRAIMDACGNPLGANVTFMKSAQVGGSAMLLNVLGFFSHQDPAPILLVQISTGEAAKFSKERVAPMIADTPVLGRVYAEHRSRASDNTIESKSFINGHLGIVGANAPSGLRSRPRRVVLFDEVDGYPPSAGVEGDPTELAIKRTTTFWNRVIVRNSTPTVEDLSRIDEEWQKSNKQRYHFPCPHCDHFQHLVFENLKWETELGRNGKKIHHPASAAYACEDCGALIEERVKRALLREEGFGGRARWIAEAPEVIDHDGFHINALYSPWFPWSELVKEFLDAKSNEMKLQVFRNTREGLPFASASSVMKEGPLLDRRKKYGKDPLPAGVCLLTMGVDVQGDRLEAEIVGWGPGMTSWSLDFLRIPGDPTGKKCWKDLDAIITRFWKHPTGRRLRIAATCIDAQHLTQEVLKFCAPRLNARVWPIRGVEGTGKPIMDRPSRNNKLKVPKYPVGTFTAKATLYARLSLEEPTEPGYCHFPLRKPYDEEFFRQLTAERRVVRQTKAGRLKEEWVRRHGRRAEVMDCRVYAMAAVEGLIAAGADLEQLAEILAGNQEESSAKKRRVRSKGVQA